MSNSPENRQQQQQSSASEEPTANTCLPCIKLLQQVLSDASSRPSQLLASMMIEHQLQQQDTGIRSALSLSSSRATGAVGAASDSTMENIDQTIASLVRLAPDGVQVRIPIEAVSESLSALPSLSATRGLPAENSDRPTSLQGHFSKATSISRSSLHLATRKSLTGATPLANSAFTTSAIARDQPPLKTEWMSLQCRPCAETGPEANARAFVMGPTPLSIVVCTNRLAQTQEIKGNAPPTTTPPPTPAARKEMEEILTHELIHVYDVRQLQLDLRTCESLAYSEVRAAAQAECVSHRSEKGFFFASNSDPTSSSPLHWRFQSCVLDKAQTATRNLFGSESKGCVQRVFYRALGDQRPFGTSPDTLDSLSSSRPSSGSSTAATTPASTSPTATVPTEDTSSSASHR